MDAPATGAPERRYAERHLADTRRRLIVAAILTVPLLIGLARMTIAPGLPAIFTDPLVQLSPRDARSAVRRLPFHAAP